MERAISRRSTSTTRTECFKEIEWLNNIDFCVAMGIMWHHVYIKVITINCIYTQLSRESQWCLCLLGRDDYETTNSEHTSIWFFWNTFVQRVLYIMQVINFILQCYIYYPTAPDTAQMGTQSAHVLPLIEFRVIWHHHVHTHTHTHTSQCACSACTMQRQFSATVERFYVL